MRTRDRAEARSGPLLLFLDLLCASAAVAKQQATLSKITTCMPELTGQINGLSVETSTQGGFVTDAYLKPGKQISSYCQSTLEPPSHP